jgi:hypothetical protein
MRDAALPYFTYQLIEDMPLNFVPSEYIVSSMSKPCRVELRTKASYPYARQGGTPRTLLIQETHGTTFR